MIAKFFKFDTQSGTWIFIRTIHLVLGRIYYTGNVCRTEDSNYTYKYEVYLDDKLQDTLFTHDNNLFEK